MVFQIDYKILSNNIIIYLFLMQTSQKLPPLSSYNDGQSRSTTGFTTSKRVHKNIEFTDNLQGGSQQEQTENILRRSNNHLMQSLLDVHLAKCIIDQTQYQIKPKTSKSRRKRGKDSRLRQQAEQLFGKALDK